MDSHLDNKSFFKFIKKEAQDYANEITDSFPYFCLKVFWDSLSHEEINGALDGLNTNDDSIDGFFVDHENSQINIIQCKSIRSIKQLRSAKKEWFSYLNDVPKKLRDCEYINNHTNIRIKDIAEEFLRFSDKEGYQSQLWLFHLGHCSEEVRNLYQKDINYRGWEDIKEEYQEYTSKLEKTEPRSIEIALHHKHIAPDLSNRHRTFVSIISGDEIIRIRKEFRYKLFDKNLRFGLGKNKINTGICDTANDFPEMFYFYNNGLTITSKGFKYKENTKKLRIEYPQIINGAQTVNSIFTAFQQKKNQLARKYPSDDAENSAIEKFREVQVLFRVIQDDGKGVGEASNFERNVIRYNNSQNSIYETDFYANAKEQIELQKYFAKFGYLYEIKRGERKYLDEHKEKHSILGMRKTDFDNWNDKISIDKLASIWMAFKEDPTLGKVQKANIFRSDYSKSYKLIFDPQKICEDYVKEMILAFNLFELVANQTSIYGNAKTTGQILLKVSQYSEDSDVKTLSNMKEIVTRSYLFGKILKRRFETKESFLEDKEKILKELQSFHFFSMANYLTIAVLRLILDKCGYTHGLIENSAYFGNKDFLERYIVGKWLKTIVDELIFEEYRKFHDSIGTSVKSFYNRAATWDQIQEAFGSLDFKLDKEYREIFPLE